MPAATATRVPFQVADCFVLALSWSHLRIDGKGAELFLAEPGWLCDGLAVAQLRVDSLGEPQP